MEPNSSHYRMADRLAHGRLQQILSEFVAAGLSPEAISRLLFAEYAIEVTGQTVGNWVTTLSLAST